MKRASRNGVMMTVGRPNPPRSARGCSKAALRCMNERIACEGRQIPFLPDVARGSLRGRNVSFTSGMCKYQHMQRTGRYLALSDRQEMAGWACAHQMDRSAFGPDRRAAAQERIYATSPSPTQKRMGLPVGKNPACCYSCASGGPCRNPSTRRNTDGVKPKFRDYTMPIAKAERMVEKPHLIKRAVERYKQFHDGKPTRVRIYEYDDGSPEVTEQVCFQMGEAHITIDTVEDEKGREVRIKPLEIGTVYNVKGKAVSNKKGKNWIHSHKEDGGKPPVHAVDVETGLVTQVGGTGFVADWMHK